MVIHRAQELMYYLPPGGTGLEKEWQQSAEQQQYVDLCARGHDMIANIIIEARKSTPPTSVTMKELYKAAASIRRAIAIEVMDPRHPKRNLYGHPMSDNDGDLIHELITPYDLPNNRYQAYFPRAHHDCNRMEDLLHDGLFQQAFGKDYSAAHNHYEDDSTIFRIFRDGLQYPAAMILRRPEGIYLYHSVVKDHDALMSMADTHLQTIINNPEMDNDTFWKEMGAASLDLYHGTPLRYGSQTATLMVLAGITKAMGYEVTPRNLAINAESPLETPYDHFMAAELIPYQEYITQYGDGFIHPPKRSAPPKDSIAVNDDFILRAQQKVQASYAGIEDPRKRLAHYLNDRREITPADDLEATEETRINPVRVTSLDIQHGKIITKISPPDQQHLVDYAIDFIGHEELINTLSLKRVRQL